MQASFFLAGPEVIHDDGDRRDTLTGTGFADIFRLSNDGRTDIILGFEDGADRIDLGALDATWDQLMVKQLSLTDYVIEYQGEEWIRVSFEMPAPEDIPPSGVLLDETDFIFRDGLPDATTQVLFEASATEAETLFGTSSPDVFVLNDDGQKDVIRKFEPGKDVIDLADYGVSFGDLRISEVREGRIIINVPGLEGRDKIVLIDVSRQLTEEDITADMFVF